jgi:hypothetical protein
VVALGTTALLVWGAGVASGAAGDLNFQGCVTGETETSTAPGGNGACAFLGFSTPGGFNSGFDNLRSIVVSPDGTSLYATASGDSSVVQFARDPGTGALTYMGCFSGETESTNCTQIPKAAAGGNNSGLSGAQAIAISPDGSSVYVAADGDDSVARFSRNPATGVLTYQDCFTGEEQSGPGPVGTDACSEIPSSQFAGTNSGLDDPQSIALTNSSLYVAARGDDAVARFSRNTSTGVLTYQGCQSGETETGATGTNACILLAGNASNGTNSGLDILQTVALSPDGASVYTASQGDSAVGRFDREATDTPALTYQGCITGEQESGPAAPPPGSGACAEIPSATSNAIDSGMLSTYAVAVSPGGNSVYSISENDDAVARFDRAPGGALTYQGCISGKTEAGGACALIPGAASTGANSGLDKLRAMLVSPDGRSVFAAVPQDDAVSRFARDPATGAIAHASCVTGEVATGPAGTGACAAIPSATANGANSGLDNPQSVAISPDGTSFYGGAANGAGIARFAVEPEPPAPSAEAGDTTPPDTQITDAPKKKSRNKSASFAFISTEPGSTFDCLLDGKQAIRPCTSPTTVMVKKGKHDFQVRATDAAGNTDPTPATYAWKVKKKKNR